MFDIITERRKRKFLFWSFYTDQVILVLTKDLSFYRYTTREYITVPKGFKSDGASVPFYFRWLVPQLGKYTKAAIFHDYLYVFKIGSRLLADIDFLITMIKSGVQKWKAELFYFSVRIGGKKWWQKKYPDNSMQIL
jgi:hypothetical protein